MQIASRRKTIAFFVVLGSALVALAVALNVGWIILNRREAVLLFFGVIFFFAIIAGMILNTIFLVREIRRNEQHGSFINAVTHELKTPITSIRLYLETMQRREIDEAQRQQFYSLMLSDTDRLLGTVEQVLKAGEVGYKRGKRHHIEVDFSELVRESIELARVRHHLAPGVLHFDSATDGAGRARKNGGPILLHGDPAELRTAVSNLLDNAVKYSGDRVDVSVASATATSDLTGKFCQPTTVQWALDTWALGNAVGRTITKMGGSTWYFISFDYALGKALQRDATEAIVKAGGSVLGSVSHPLGATDFGSYLLQAQASGAKVIALADTGADAINAIRQAAEFQIVGPDRRLAALFLQITDIDALGLNAAQGLILSEAFYWDLNDQTRAFATRFAERMGGKMPTEDQAAAYSTTLAYLRAVKTAGTIEGDKVVAEMKKSPIDDPLFGPVVVRADGRATHAMYVFKVKSPQQSKSRYDVYDLIETIPAEAAFRPLDQGRCSLVK